MDEATRVARVYSPLQVAVAAFIGGPLPACWLAALNAGELRQPAQRAVWFAVGLVGSVLVLYIGLFLLPDWVPPFVFPIAYTIALREAVRNIQGNDLTDLRAAGARQGSWAIVLGFALVGLVLMLGIVAIIVYKFPAALPQRTH
jgi:multisubunit Na+/H+ antiporter MnhB subunit